MTRSTRHTQADGSSPPRACVLGDVDLVAALGLAGVRCAVVTPAHDPARFSRHTDRWIPWIDHWHRAEELVERLLAFAAEADQPPVLYFQTDGDLLVVSRYREALGAAFRFVVAERQLVEDVVDKARFAALARRLGLPTPATVVLDPGEAPHRRLADLRFPVVVKPWTRDGLARIGVASKALRVDSAAQVDPVWRSCGLAKQGVGVVVQELVAGPESAIESYHAYVGTDAAVVAEFTGVKVRTHPREFGHSTVVATSDAQDVRTAGRDVVRRLGLTGVVKLDYKRCPDGRLLLLEVNPRFTLWQHVGAVAGVNLAALVHADLVGAPRPTGDRARPGVVWCDPVRDLRGVMAGQLGLGQWLRTTLTCDARSGADHRDFAPLLRGRLAGGVARRGRSVLVRNAA